MEKKNEKENTNGGNEMGDETRKTVERFQQDLDEAKRQNERGVDQAVEILRKGKEYSLR